MKLRAKEQTIERIPRKPVNALGPGLVDVEGVAMPDGSMLTAPFSVNECVFYSWKIEQQGRYGYSTIAEGQSEHSFLVTDDTGTVRVMPLGAERFLHNTNEWKYGLFDAIRSEVEEGCKRLSRSVPSRWGGGIRCQEAYLAAGDKVFVQGTVIVNPHSRTDNSADSFYLAKASKDALIISDDSETRLVERLNWKAFGMIFGGPALSVACLYALYLFYSR